MKMDKMFRCISYIQVPKIITKIDQRSTELSKKITLAHFCLRHGVTVKAHPERCDRTELNWTDMI